MKKNSNKHLGSFEEHLDLKYGRRGTRPREKYEVGYEAFKLGVLISEERKKRHLTQEELALKAGTTKQSISRIEKDASGIRLATLLKIIRDGLGGTLRVSVEF